jgi:hypothetical protein
VASDQFLCPVRSVRITRHSSRRFGFLEPLFFRLEQATRKQRTLVPSLDTAFRFRFAGCEAEQPTRRALLSASRRLPLAAVDVPRLASRPGRKRGRETKRGEEGSRWSLPARRQRRAALAFSLSGPPQHREVGRGFFRFRRHSSGLGMVRHHASCWHSCRMKGPGSWKGPVGMTENSIYLQKHRGQ